MAHRHPLIGWTTRIIDRHLPTLSQKLKRRRLMRDLLLLPDNQLLFDATGNLRPLDDLLRRLSRVLHSGNVKRDRRAFLQKSEEMLINIEMIRRLGRLCPISAFEQGAGIQGPWTSGPQPMRVYQLIINRSMTLAQVDRHATSMDHYQYGVYASLKVNHSYADLSIATAKAIDIISHPVTLEGLRLYQLLEQWHRSMQHLIDGTYALDAIAALAIQTSGPQNYPVYDKTAFNLEQLAKAERKRRAFNESASFKKSAVYYPATPGITAKHSAKTSFGAIHFHPQIETQGILAMIRPITIISTQNYTLIEMQIPESIVGDYIGKPLSVLLDHPLLNSLEMTIRAIDTKPPPKPLDPTRLERQVLEIIENRFLMIDRQPQLDQWFKMQGTLTDGSQPMIMIHHFPEKSTLITRTQVDSFHPS